MPCIKSMATQSGWQTLSGLFSQSQVLYLCRLYNIIRGGNAWWGWNFGTFCRYEAAPQVPDQVLSGEEESNSLLFWEQRVAAVQKVCKCAQSELLPTDCIIKLSEKQSVDCVLPFQNVFEIGKLLLHHCVTCGWDGFEVILFSLLSFWPGDSCVLIGCRTQRGH